MGLKEAEGWYKWHFEPKMPEGPLCGIQNAFLRTVFPKSVTCKRCLRMMANKTNGSGGK